MFNRRQFLTGIAASAAAVALVRQTADGAALKGIKHPMVKATRPADNMLLNSKSLEVLEVDIPVQVQRWVTRESLEGGQWDHVIWTQVLPYDRKVFMDHDMVLIEYTT